MHPLTPPVPAEPLFSLVLEPAQCSAVQLRKSNVFPITPNAHERKSSKNKLNEGERKDIRKKRGKDKSVEEMEACDEVRNVLNIEAIKSELMFTLL